LPFNFGKLKIKCPREYNTQIYNVRIPILLSKIRRKYKRNRQGKKEDRIGRTNGAQAINETKVSFRRNCVN
jgi:hypothetical protein